MERAASQAPGEAAAGSRASPMRWHRAVATGLALLFVIYIGYACWRNYADPPGVDFVSFWAAATMALDGQAGLAYDVAAHRAVELTVGKVDGVLPFPYPPPYLFFVLPFGLLPFWLAFALWVSITGALYVLAARPVAPLPYSLVNPAALPCALIGQNGLLMTAIFIRGTTFLHSRPFTGGLLLGLLVVKPQLALLLPVALLAGREWRAIAGAAASSMGLLLLALAAFGWEAYQGFIDILPRYAGFLRGSQWPWNELASPFALFRFLGLPQGSALLLHAAIAAGAAAVTWRSWAIRSDHRIAVLATATVLVPPYLFTYDALLLIVPLCLFIREERRLLSAAVWLFCLLPIASYTPAYSGPNTTMIAALLSLWGLHFRPEQGERRLKPWALVGRGDGGDGRRSLPR
ncbi:MAG TPA: glycosyltransferase family 87 protein [Sphingomicrobium sp.]|nr:glycosyltransferase family 87 protein [Sphingomicrobium sp.]